MPTEEPTRPDRKLAAKRYRRLVKTYGLWKRPTERLRARAVDALDLSRDDVVLDVGCGTGYSFPAIHERISDEGRLVGIDLSTTMLERAQDLVERKGWDDRTELVEAPIEEFALEGQADAALFFFTHDILQTPQAIKNVLKQLKPGGRVAVGGMKFAPEGARVRNGIVRRLASPYVTTFSGYDRPWQHLAELVGDLEVTPTWAGVAYLAEGTAA